MARLALARASHPEDPEFARSLLQMLKVAAATLGVSRVGVWKIAAEWTRLDCEALYESGAELFSPAPSIELAQYPAYAAALKEHRVIAAEDARSDPRTHELGATYLVPNDIAAMLDCPIYENGEVVAILCHEQVGAARVWSKRDCDFAVNVADILSTLFAQSKRLRYEVELRHAREALAEARVMDSLGRMAAHVAHDFNNTLLGISLGLSAIAQSQMSPSSLSALADSRELVEQGSRLVRQLLAFARTGGSEGHSTDLCATVTAMLPRLQRLLGPDIALQSQVLNESLSISLDLASLEQVLMNLTLNARDALRGGGKVTLTADATPEQVTLRVGDSGVGMDEATRQRIFEPFFSTKGQRGSGLGLAIVFGAVRQAGGSIEVESQVGRGTTFTLRFPRLPT